MRSSTLKINRVEKFRNTIDPEFTSLRKYLGRCKTVGLIQILLGCTMVGTAVFIILGFKATFLEGQSVGSRITPNLVIGFTCLFSGLKAFMMKGEVGFSIDNSGLKCVVGLCCILTIVAFAMSAILIGLSSYELYTLNYPEGRRQYSYVNDRKGLNILNIVFSCISTVLCVGCLVVFVQMAAMMPRRRRQSSLVYPQDSQISVIQGHAFGQPPTADNQVSFTSFSYDASSTDFVNPEPTRVNNGTIHHYL